MNTLIRMRAIGLLCCLLLTHRAFSQTTRYVSTTGITPAASATTSWATSTTDLQGAIEASQPGDQVWVVAGTYRPASGSSFSMKAGVAIYGGFAGGETSLSQRQAVNPVVGTPSNTTLAGNGSRVITNLASLSLTTTAMLDGFVITGSSPLPGMGAGVINVGSGDGAVCSPSFRNCLFTGNSGQYGAAMFNRGGNNGNASPVLINCSFTNNSAQYGFGGAIYNDGFTGQSSPVLINCSFTNNSAQYGFGGAIYNDGSSGQSSPILTNCSFTGNSVAAGGAIYNDGSSGQSSPILTNCIFFGNGGSNAIVNLSASVIARYSLFENGETNFNSDPTNITGVTTSPFAGTATVALAACSPAINAGNPASITVVSGPYSATALPATDLAGNPRIIEGRIDIGAVEYQQPKYPARLYVAASQTANVGDGQSWATAFPDLQSALNYPCSQSLTEIWVAAGTYKPTSTTARDISFSMKNGVSILGGFPVTGTPTMAERNPASHLTILSGDLKGDDGPDFSNNGDNSYHVIHNWPGLTNSAVLDGFVITGGNANGQTNETLSGGGVYNNGSSIQFVCNPSFRNCSFVGNAASDNGGAIYNFATFGMQASPILTNCSLQRNSANRGGAIFNNGDSGSSSSPILTNCSLQSNSATEGGAIYNSGGYGGHSDPVLTNCSLQNNSATMGGAMYNKGDIPGYSDPVLINCILVNNGSVPFYNNKATGASATYSLFDNPANVNISGPGNLTVTTSPFVSATSVALAPCSPAINAGNPNTTTLTVGTTDLTGSPRITGTRIDMGAVEYQNQNGVPLQIVQQPVAASVVCAGTTVVVSVSVTGSAPAYQWYRSGTALTGIASATTASLTLTNAQLTDAGSYSVIISGDCPSVTSTAFSLSVNALPSVTVTAAPSATLSCANPSLTLTAQTSATAFAWSGGGSTVQTLPVSQTGVYSVTVTGANGCSAVSNSPVVSRDNTSPTVSVSVLSTTLTCTRPTLTLTATASVTALLWSAGQTTTTISVSQTGTYSVTATGANGCTAVSNNLIIGADYSLPTFSVSSATVCPGQSVNLTASGCSGQILWSTGATTAMITLTAGSSTSLLTATCTVGSCSTTASGQIAIGGIQPPPAQILSFTADESACPVRLTGRGVASSFTMTGTQGYVFSTVYREGATHEAVGLNVKQAGTYTLTATYTNSCGTSAPVVRTVSVGRSCP